MSGKNASFLINPRAGENTAKLPDILAVLAAGGWKTEIGLKEYGGHIMEQAREATEQKKNLLIAYGGDGTLNQVVNGVMSAKGKRPIVGLIPGGTANVWAGEIGVPADPVKAALTLLNSDVRKVDVGCVFVRSIAFPGEDQPSGASLEKSRKKAAEESAKVRHHFLLMAGLGLDAAVMGNVSKPLKYQIGTAAVGLAAAQELPEQHPYPIEIQSGEAGDSLWKGEAIQVVLGNTRRYATAQRMTPEAYVDDGQIDVCVITAGNPLSTLQQVTSLLLRQKPDNTTAQYFKGSHLRIKVPATIALQVDGSAVKLKDYLSAADYKKLSKLDKEAQEQVFVTYQIDTLPQALPVAIPRAYDDELFEHGYHPEDKQEQITNAESAPSSGQKLKRGLFSRFTKEDDRSVETSSQKQTAVEETLASSEIKQEKISEKREEHQKELSRELPDVMESLSQHGRKVAVFAKAPNAAVSDTYVIAGAVQKSSGQSAPGAVVVNAKTTIFDHHGHYVNDLNAAMQELTEGAVVIVEGKRSKRNVVQAKRIVLP
ncbi:hypothetical protein KDA_37090 [Dictyobacter alpinus]|uniref:DAGKc domain-containing protein n=1 Tax=Dictyobacter alpinus TaxID=2014873 RepID=A0A402BA51_9CHLR|nr:diacylglycerol kinase family protein [Dictyobacter alpinus]GCE28225.1 hypothetical protein KDA_37090 [Dictyobacter alpinus]